MLAISCPSCPHMILLNGTDDRPPPWCPRCGSDFKVRSVPTQAVTDAACKRWTARTEPNTAVAITPPAADKLQVETSPPLVHALEPRLEPMLLPEPISPPKAAPVPSWAKLFAFACGIIPLLTLGGAIPTAIGFGGASSCLAVARNPQMDLGTRLLLCAAITGGCWMSVFVVIGAFMRVLR